ncbi:hypothetical protein [uncultured Amphritea sp.]|uniref:hypothetical protein n=1 Tax=uncultured Amphritea sp. TaxID=981605 RepID=UPI0026268050|nr:hypothetical protein [uncultured Amphritea sp.]
MSGTNTETLNAGEFREYDGGNAWELIACDNPVKVETIKEGRILRRDEVAAVGSYDRYHQFSGANIRAFTTVKVTALTDNTTFTLSVSDGQSGKNMVVNEVERIVQPVDVQSVAMIDDIAPFDLSVGFSRHIRSVTATVQTLITPAENVGGCIIDAAHAGGSGLITANATAVASVIDVSVSAIIACSSNMIVGSNTVATNQGVSHKSGFKIPPGLGVYFQAWSSGEQVAVIQGRFL